MSEAIYTFNGKDITLNVCIQIRAVVDELQKRLNVSFEDAMLMFYRSETYKTLQETENAFWAPDKANTWSAFPVNKSKGFGAKREMI